MICLEKKNSANIREFNNPTPCLIEHADNKLTLCFIHLQSTPKGQLSAFYSQKHQKKRKKNKIIFTYLK